MMTSNAVLKLPNALKFLALCIWLVNAGCTPRQIFLSDIHPQIHLYTAMESGPRVRAVSEVLRAQDYSVVLTELPVPIEFVRTTIIYSPIISQDDVNDIARSLEELGYTKIEKILQSAENHSYSRFNAGVYLVP